MADVVVVTKGAQKDLKSVPEQVSKKFAVWVDAVQTDGLEAVRKRPGYHDEPLKGKLAGSRSIRLSLGYRAYYRIEAGGQVRIVRVTGVDKHNYGK